MNKDIKKGRLKKKYIKELLALDKTIYNSIGLNWQVWKSDLNSHYWNMNNGKLCSRLSLKKKLSTIN